MSPTTPHQPTDTPSKVNVEQEWLAKWVSNKLNDNDEGKTFWANGTYVCTWQMTENELAGWVDAAIE